jgi:transcriptional regulator with XRE-family HTH domain
VAILANAASLAGGTVRLYSITEHMTARLKQQVVGAHVRELRKRSRLTVRALAAKTGFSPSFISQLERGEVSPSLHSMEKIAAALGKTLSSFFAALAPAAGGIVVRAGDRTSLDSSWSNAQIEALLPAGADRRQEPMLVTLRARGRSGKHPVAHRTEEFGLVLEGRVVLRLGPDEHVLCAGDAVLLQAGELRLWSNPDAKRARVLIVAIRDVP